MLVSSNFKFTSRFIIFELKIIYVYFTCMVNLLACVSVYHECASPWTLEERVGASGTDGDSRKFLAPLWGWALNQMWKFSHRERLAEGIPFQYFFPSRLTRLRCMCRVCLLLRYPTPRGTSGHFVLGLCPGLL